MISKGERTRDRVILLFFIILLIMVGSGGYFYYVRHKEPTQGIFVYNTDMGWEELACGYLYQPS